MQIYFAAYVVSKNNNMSHLSLSLKSFLKDYSDYIQYEVKKHTLAYTVALDMPLSNALKCLCFKLKLFV